MQFHSTAVFVSDIERSKDFYTGFLNMEVEHDFGKNVILHNGITLWEIQEAHTIARELATQEPTNRFELYFESDEIEESFEVLKNAGIPFLHEIHEEPWGQRTMRFFDPDGHLIEVGEPLEVFVRNMYKKGLSPEEIKQKSGIPIETINDLLSGF